LLVLSRHRDESIVLAFPDGIPPGSRIKATVVDIRGDKCRIGVEAPITVEVDREEVRQAKDRERAAGRRDIP
jgi:carbon storage regulator